MSKTPTKLRYYFKWFLWIILTQFILANISAAIYAYHFTHFYLGNPPAIESKNMLQETWKIFTGPRFYKLEKEASPTFSYESIPLRTNNNIAIDAWYGAVDSVKKCVILFHGISLNKSFVLSEASMFKDWGYNVMLVDFRGHGRSEGQTSTFGVKETDEVAKAFEYAKSKGNTEIVLYGVSLGAATIIKATAEGKVQPSAIIAEMPFDNLHHHLKARAKDVGFPPEPFAFMVTAWIGMERGYNGFNHDVSSYAQKVNCPVLVQWGEKDRYVNRKEIEAVYNNLASSKKDMVVYPNADHESLLHVDPIQWKKEVQSFLTALH